MTLAALFDGDGANTKAHSDTYLTVVMAALSGLFSVIEQT